MDQEDASALRAKQLLQLKASAADAMNAVAALDMALVMLLADIVQPPPFARQDLELASIIIFSQTTIERRIDIVRKVITLRLAGLMERKPHEYPHKVGAFVIKAFNIVAAAATKETWIRNTAAHGNYFLPQTGEPRIIPIPFDFEGVQRHNERRGIKGSAMFNPDSGFTASELTAFSDSLKRPHNQFGMVRDALEPILKNGAQEALDKALVALGKDLKLQVPLQVRPHRERREPKQSA
jgi:hypothetical protein